ASGEVCGITLDYTAMADGRLAVTGESITLASDQIFKAIGQTPAESILTEAGLALSKGRISVDADRRTSIPGIWAGGDCIAGGQDLTVAAVQ
ncbi:FAD-dependent oxidoreductase, partial [Mycobacterium tuberculosis]|nr:FAD-dependent oxidoreductase [Mycobacterium tuberculosis]